MTSIQASLKSVFGGRAGAEQAGLQQFPRTWSLFKFPTPVRAERPSEGLAEIVDREIVPRLVRAHGGAPPPADAALAGEAEDNPLGADSTRAFAGMLLSRTPDDLAAFVETLSSGGVTAEAIYADLLAPTARLLVDLWDDDRASYTEVTIGLGRLQHLVRGLDGPTPYDGDGLSQAKSALFAPRPGEQQTFGFYMIEELFRWAGWRTWVETAATNEQLAATVRCHGFDMVCLSVARDRGLAEVSATIDVLRRASRNRSLFVLVNGQPFAERPELLAKIGADAAASNGGEALAAAGAALGCLAPAE